MAGSNGKVKGISTAAVRSLMLVLVAFALVGSALVAQPAVADAAPRRGYQFIAQNQAGQPVRWNPNRPIRYVLNLGGNEARRNEVGQALSIVTQATGIPFQYVGDTNYVPTMARPLPDEVWNAPDRNTPYDVQITFATQRQSNMLAGRHRGMAAQRWTSEILHGTVVVDTEDTVPGWGIGSDGSVLLHELAHLMGLAHVDDPSSLMYPTDGATASFSAADWEGLRQLGNGRGLAYDPGRFPPPVADGVTTPAVAAAGRPRPATVHAPVHAPAPAPVGQHQDASNGAGRSNKGPAPTPAPVTSVPVTAAPTPAPTPAPATPAPAAADAADAFEALLARPY